MVTELFDSLAYLKVISASFLFFVRVKRVSTGIAKPLPSFAISLLISSRLLINRSANIFEYLARILLSDKSSIFMFKVKKFDEILSVISIL